MSLIITSTFKMLIEIPKRILDVEKVRAVDNTIIYLEK